MNTLQAREWCSLACGLPDRHPENVRKKSTPASSHAVFSPPAVAVRGAGGVSSSWSSSSPLRAARKTREKAATRGTFVLWASR